MYHSNPCLFGRSSSESATVVKSVASFTAFALVPYIYTYIFTLFPPLPLIPPLLLSVGLVCSVLFSLFCLVLIESGSEAVWLLFGSVFVCCLVVVADKLLAVL